MYGRIIYADQSLILNNYNLSGIQSVNVNSNLSISPVNILGMGNRGKTFGQLPNYSLDISRVIVSYDPLFDIITGVDYTTGIYIAKDVYYMFQEPAVINSLRLSCQVDELLSSSFTINCYGDFTSGNYTGQFKQEMESGNIAQYIKIPTWQSTTVVADHFPTHRPVGFEYTVNFDKNPIYAIGSRYPVDFYNKSPIVEQLKVDFEMDKLQYFELKNNLCVSGFIENIFIQLQTVCKTADVAIIDFRSGYLVSQSSQGAIGSNVKASFTFEKVSNIDFPSLCIRSGIFITGYESRDVINGPAYTGKGDSYQIPPYTGWIGTGYGN